MCLDSTGPVPAVSFIDRDVRFPQNLKIAMGIDRELVRGLLATLELLYTHGVKGLYFTDVNLQPPSSVEAGEGGRAMYGTIDASGNPAIAHPYRRDTTLLQVIRVSNRSGDQAYSVAARLERRFRSSRLSATYAYAHARDLFSLNNFNARPTLQGPPLDGTLEGRRDGGAGRQERPRLRAAGLARHQARRGIDLCAAQLLHRKRAMPARAARTN